MANTDITYNAGTAGTMTDKALRFAKMESKETSSALVNIMNVNEEKKGGPVKLFLTLVSNYGEVMDEFPRPGTESGNNPERYKVEYQRNGKDATKTVSFYAELFDRMKEGVAIAATLDHIARAQDAKAIKDGIPEDIMDMNAEALEAKAERLKTRRSNAIAAIRTAMSLAFQLEDISSLEHVVAKIRYEEEGVPCVGEKAVGVYDKTDPAKYALFSVGAFLLLDPGKAREKGGTVKAVRESVKRAKKGTPASVAAPQTIATLDTFKARVTDVHSFMDGVWNGTDKHQFTEILKAVGPKAPAGNGDFALSLYEIYNMLGNIFRKEEILNHVQRLEEQAALGQSKAA